VTAQFRYIIEEYYYCMRSANLSKRTNPNLTLSWTTVEESVAILVGNSTVNGWKVVLKSPVD